MSKYIYTPQYKLNSAADQDKGFESKLGYYYNSAGVKVWTFDGNPINSGTLLHQGYAARKGYHEEKIWDQGVIQTNADTYSNFTFAHNGETGMYYTVVGGDKGQTLNGAGHSYTYDNGAKSWVTTYALPDRIFGMGGNDTIKGYGGPDLLDGGSGNDVIYGGDGNPEHFRLGHDNDTISGGAGHDKLYGEAGNDLIYGGSGNDQIDGGIHNDTIHGGSGSDSIKGGAGHDNITGGANSDTIYGGADNDTIDGGTENDSLYGERGNDIIYGGAGDDKIFGGEGIDKLYGGAGADTIKGDMGSDVLYGGKNNDVLHSGNGWHSDTFAKNTLYGGTGADTFVIDGGMNNLLKDFDVREGDKLQIDASTYGVANKDDMKIEWSYESGSGDLIATIKSGGPEVGKNLVRVERGLIENGDFSFNNVDGKLVPTGDWFLIV